MLTCPRSASNLFQTMLAKQPHHKSTSYYFFNSGMACMGAITKGRWADLDEVKRRELTDSYQSGYNQLAAEVHKTKSEVGQIQRGVSLI